MANKARDTQTTEEETDSRGESIAYADLKAGMWIRCTKSAVPKLSQPWFTKESYIHANVVGQVDMAYSYAKAIKTIDYDTRYTSNEGEYELLTPKEIKEVHRQRVLSQRENLTIDRGYTHALYIGLDPEIFVTTPDGVVIPAFSFLPSKKEAGTSTAGGTSTPYWDGFQAEWNTRPTYCHAWVVDYVQAGLKAVIAKARLQQDSPRLSSASVVELPREVLRKAKPEHVEFGCSPSKNAYGDEIAIPSGTEVPLRFAGFHIHFGYKKIYPTFSASDYNRLVKGIDRILGPIMVSTLVGIEDTRRRAFYGRAGEYRLPAHGLEYRVPSSTVMCNPLVTHLILDLARYAGHIAINNLEEVWENDGDEQVRHIINDYDVNEARKVIKHNLPILKAMLNNCYAKNADNALSIITNGAVNTINTTAMHENWRINGTWQTHSDGANESIIRSNGDIFKTK